MTAIMPDTQSTDEQLSNIVSIDAALERAGLRGGVTETARPCSLRWIAQQLDRAGARLMPCECGTDEPSEYCPQHGRGHDGWIEFAEALMAENHDLREIAGKRATS